MILVEEHVHSSSQRKHEEKWRQHLQLPAVAGTKGHCLGKEEGTLVVSKIFALFCPAVYEI